MRRDSRIASFTVAIHLEQGSASVLFIFIIIPVLCALFAIALDLIHFFGIRDELQRIVDRAAHDGLIQGHTLDQVEKGIKAHMQYAQGVAEIISVNMTHVSAGSVIQVRGVFRGLLTGVLSVFLGENVSRIVLQVRSEVRIQPLTAILILDRSVLDPYRECSDPALSAMSLFLDRVVDSWMSLEKVSVHVGISPGRHEAVEPLSIDGSDKISRCRARSNSHYLDVSGIRGSVQSNPLRSLDVAYSAYSFIEQALSSHPSGPAMVLYVLGRSAYDTGYAAELYSQIRESGVTSVRRVDYYALIQDDKDSLNLRSFSQETPGGVYREITCTKQDFEGVTLLGATVKMAADRISLER